MADYLIGMIVAVAVIAAVRYIYKAKKERFSDMPYTLTIGIEGNSVLYIKKVKPLT